MDSFIIDYKSKIFSLYGNVKRARNCYLYTESGVRITDMYQNNGRGILGWRHGKSMQFFKNVFDRGVLGDFDTDYQKQLQKSLIKLFPNMTSFLIYEENNLPLEFIDIPCYRPWISDSSEKSRVFKFYPPFPWGNILFIIFTDNTIINSKIGISLPSPLLAAYTRSIFDLINELSLRNEEIFCKYDKILLKYFNRNGPYLLPKCTKNEYFNLWENAINVGVLLSPKYEDYSIIPYGANIGDIKKIHI